MKAKAFQKLFDGAAAGRGQQKHSYQEYMSNSVNVTYGVKKKEYDAINRRPRTQLAFMRDSVLSRAKCFLCCYKVEYSVVAVDISIFTMIIHVSSLYTASILIMTGFFHEPTVQLRMTNDRNQLTSVLLYFTVL